MVEWKDRFPVRLKSVVRLRVIAGYFTVVDGQFPGPVTIPIVTEKAPAAKCRKSVLKRWLESSPL